MEFVGIVNGNTNKGIEPCRAAVARTFSLPTLPLVRDTSLLKVERDNLEEEIKRLMIPSDPNDDKNIIMEIRGAAGGDEAQLFAGDLYEMYNRYATSQGWRVEVVESSSNDIGGFKEITLQIQGDNVYSKLKFESGAHRVQRVPDTESQGRVHTSTATVGVMPELEDIDFDLDDGDIRIDI